MTEQAKKPPNPTYFISYARDDLPYVRKIADELEKANCTVWYDQANLKPGQNWQEQIDKALDDATVVVCVISPASVSNKSTRLEWAEIQEKMWESKDTKFCSVVLDQIDPPAFIRNQPSLHADKEKTKSLGIVIKELLHGGLPSDVGQPLRGGKTEGEIASSPSRNERFSHLLQEFGKDDPNEDVR